MTIDKPWRYGSCKVDYARSEERVYLFGRRRGGREVLAVAVLPRPKRKRGRF